MFGQACRRCAVAAADAGPSTYLLPARTFCTSPIRLAKKKVPVNPNAKSLAVAAQLLKDHEATRKRTYSAFELEIVTKIDKSAPPLRGRIALPRDARRVGEDVLVFCEEGPARDAATKAGAKWVGGEDLIPLVLSSEIAPTKVLSTPTLLPTITPKLGKYLGIKGLMPAAKRGTVVERGDLEIAVKEAKGMMEWKGDKQGHVRAAVARINFPIPDVELNVRQLIKAVRDGSNSSSVLDNTSQKKKGSSIVKVNLGSTTGPTFELNDVL